MYEREADRKRTLISIIITIRKFRISPSPPLGSKDTDKKRKKPHDEIDYDTVKAKEVRQLTSFVNPLNH
jgi:hypothetical protein